MGTFELDMATGRVARDRSLEELYGLEPGAASTLAEWASLIHPDDRAMVLDHVARVATEVGSTASCTGSCTPTARSAGWNGGATPMPDRMAGWPASAASWSAGLTADEIARRAPWSSLRGGEVARRARLRHRPASKSRRARRFVEGQPADDMAVVPVRVPPR